MPEEVTQTQAEKDQDEFNKVWEDNEDAGTKPAGEVIPPVVSEELVADPDKVATPEAVDVTAAPVVETDEVKQLRDELAKERQKTASWDGRIKAANARAENAERAARELQDKPKVEPKVAPVDADADEEAAVKSFSDEFPDLPKPILALVKKNMLPVIREMIKAERSNYEPVVQEVKSLKQQISVNDETAHYDAITKACPDWKTIVSSGELDKFIASQPSYMRKALEDVRAEGATQEVIDMFGQYSNWKSPSTSTKPIKPVVDPNADVKDMIAVTQSPGGPALGKKVIDKDDFDGAWEEAQKSG